MIGWRGCDLLVANIRSTCKDQWLPGKTIQASKLSSLFNLVIVYLLSTVALLLKFWQNRISLEVVNSRCIKFSSLCRQMVRHQNCLSHLTSHQLGKSIHIFRSHTLLCPNILLCMVSYGNPSLQQRGLAVSWPERDKSFSSMHRAEQWHK